MIEISEVNDFDQKTIQRNDKIKFLCIECKKVCIINSFRKSRLSRYKTMLCEKCYRKKISLRKWGTPAPQMSNKVKRIVETNNYIKYGKPYINTFGSKEWYSNMETKYGVKYAQQSEKIKEKTKNNNINKYGVSHWSKSKDHKDRSSEIISKIKNTNKIRYGTDSYSKTNEFIEKRIKTSIEKYGTPYYQQSSVYKNSFNTYIYYGLSFDSIPEFAVYLYCTYFGIPIIRNYTIGFDYIDNKGMMHKVFPDFIINGKLVEIKGGHFFKEDGTMYLPYRNKEWSDEEYKYQSSIYESKRKCLINNGVLIYKDTDPWIIECIKYIKNILDCKLYLKSNVNNICYGYSPFNINKEDEYCPVEGLGLSPFDNIGVFNHETYTIV